VHLIIIFFVPLVLFVVACISIGLAVMTRGCVGVAERVATSTVRSNAALGWSVVAILAFTLLPMHERDEVHLVPLGDVIEAFTPPLQKTLLLQVASNVVLFMPLGAALRLREFSIRKTSLTACALSTAVEVTQLLLVSGRTAAVDDVLLNTLGAVLGSALVSLWVLPLKRTSVGG
jgi:glycopeptide antibiotics resistance protein